MAGLNEGRVQGDEQRIERGSMAGISRKVLWKETKGEILRGASYCGFIFSSCNGGGGQEQGLLRGGTDKLSSNCYQISVMSVL